MRREGEPRGEAGDDREGEAGDDREGTGDDREGRLVMIGRGGW